MKDGTCRRLQGINFQTRGPSQVFNEILNSLLGAGTTKSMKTKSSTLKMPRNVTSLGRFSFSLKLRASFPLKTPMVGLDDSFPFGTRPILRGFGN